MDEIEKDKDYNGYLTDEIIQSIIEASIRKCSEAGEPCSIKKLQVCCFERWGWYMKFDNFTKNLKKCAVKKDDSDDNLYWTEQRYGKIQKAKDLNRNI